MSLPPTAEVGSSVTGMAARVRTLLSRQQLPEALQLIDACLLKHPEHAELLLLRAQALLASGRNDAAIPAFGAAIAAAPRIGAAELGLAVALGQSGQPADAEIAARNAIAKGFDNAGARFVLARSLFDQSRFEAAEAAFRDVLRLDTGHAAAVTSLAETIWLRTGDAQAALASLASAPSQSIELILLKAKLRGAADPQAELAELEAALDAAPANVPLRIAAAQAVILHDPARALRHAEKALRGAPQNRAAFGLYGDTLLAAGHAGQASSVAARLLEIDGNDGHAIALQTSAWRMLGDARHRELCDYARVVLAQRIDTPEGWTDLPAYLRDLTMSLRALHGLRAHPLHQTLRHGAQIELHPEHSDDPALRAFPQAIDRPIRRYLRQLGQGPDVLRRRNTGDYRFSGMWSVQLRAHGYHFNHFHGKGWLSSACYIHLPENMGASGGEGWLQFGEPVMPTQPPLPAEYFVKPEPGLLVLFPAWMWHGTVPFSGGPDSTRLTIAFDLVPR